MRDGRTEWNQYSKPIDLTQINIQEGKWRLVWCKNRQHNYDNAKIVLPGFNRADFILNWVCYLPCLKIFIEAPVSHTYSQKHVDLLYAATKRTQIMKHKRTRFETFMVRYASRLCNKHFQMKPENIPVLISLLFFMFLFFSASCFFVLILFNIWWWSLHFALCPCPQFVMSMLLS